MSFFIKQLHDAIDLATDQGISNYWTRAQIDDAVDQAQMGLFRLILKEFAETRTIRNELLPFQKVASVTIASQIGDLPADFEHEIEWYVTVSSIKYPIKIIELGTYRKRILDPIDPPTSTNVFGQIYNNSGKKIEISSQITPITLHYFKRPVKPVYGTTMVDGQETYNEGTSTDLEWSEVMYDILLEKSLPLLGLGMKDGMIFNATRGPMTKEQTVV